MVAKGYKNTEIGVIPEDWEVVELGTIAQVTKLAGFEYSNYFNSYKDGGDIIVLRGTNITNNILDLSDIKSIPSHISKKLQRSKLYKNDLVFAYVGTIGPVYLIEENDKYHLGPNTSKITLDKTNSVVYLYCYFKSFLIKNEINQRVSVGAQPSLSMAKIRSFNIILPPKPEQLAIATALSDADALISATEKLIAKKKAIKQGTMQELLKPKEGWEENILGEVCEVVGRIGFRGYTIKDIVSEYSGAITFGPSNLINGKMDYSKLTFISWEKYYESPEIMIQNGDILFVKTASVGRVGLVKNLPIKATINPQLVVLKKIKINNEFLSYQMQFDFFQDQVRAKLGGGVLATLTQEDIKNFRIFIPKENEQTRIAAILSDIDAEISLLEQKLEKQKHIKQGMMQNLLTGKIRLL